MYSHQAYKRIYQVGVLAYIIYFILAIWLFKERMIFTDSAYYVFQIVKNKDFAIQHSRYGAVFTQIFPLLASIASFSLETLIKLYSAIFVAYYFTCYIICGSIFKNYTLALVVLLINSLAVSDTFFFMLSELPMGMAFLIVVVTFLQSIDTEKPGWGKYLVLVFLIFSLNFFHPLILLCTAFSVAFFFLRGNDGKRKRLFFIAGCLFVVLYVVKSMTFKSTHDSEAMEGVKNIKYLFPHYFGLASNRRFFQESTYKYYWLVIFFILIGISYIYKKQWLLAALFACSAIGYWFLINISYPNAVECSFYMENLYLPLSLIVALPLVYDVIPKLGQKGIWVVFIFIILSSFWRIWMVKDKYIARLNWERKYLHESQGRKLFVSQKLVPADTLMMTWATPYEFWLLSTIETGKSASILINEKIDQYEYAKWENKTFISTWGNFPYSELKRPYFNFEDTVSQYEVLR